MKEEEEIEQLEREHEFLLEHGTDLKVKYNGFSITLYFSGGKYQERLEPEETEILTGHKQKATIYINKNQLAVVKTRDFETILEGAEII